MLVLFLVAMFCFIFPGKHENSIILAYNNFRRKFLFFKKMLIILNFLIPIWLFFNYLGLFFSYVLIFGFVGINIVKQKNKLSYRDLLQEILTVLVQIENKLKIGLLPVAAISAVASAGENDSNLMLRRYVMQRKYDEIVNIGITKLNSGLWNHIFTIWYQAEKNGLSFIAVQSSIIKQIKFIQTANQNLEVELSGAKTTANTLLLLPILGILFSYLIGANSLKVLLFNKVGNIVLFCGLLFIIIGKFWSDKLTNISGEQL